MSRIAKLKALAADPATFPAEAEAALRKAKELRSKETLAARKHNAQARAEIEAAWGRNPTVKTYLADVFAMTGDLRECIPPWLNMSKTK